MGAGIVEVCAKADKDIVVLQVSEAAIEAGSARVTASVDRAVPSGRIDPKVASRLIQLVTWTTSVSDLAGRDLIIEAAPELES